ncbi:MAG TPA: DNA translocase FtsK [Acidocella sp.]|nr:DNA translocase FtsK [Acidocella sp.]
MGGIVASLISHVSAGHMLPSIVMGITLIAGLACFGYALGISPGEWRAGGQHAARAAAASVQQGRRGAEAVSSWLSVLQTTAEQQAAPRSAWVPAPQEEDDDEPDFAPPMRPASPVPVPPQQAKPAVKPNIAVSRPAPRQERLALPELGWTLPSLDLLRPAPQRAGTGPTEEALQSNARLLETVLQDYGVQGKIVEIRPGPVVTLYELEPAPGIRSARVVGLAEDIARSLSVIAVRIATVAGRNVIGIEVPNAKRETVYLSELLGSSLWESQHGALSLALGKDISGAPVVADLARMPHLLIAGTTGSGKSVGVNAMIISLLYRLSPEQCRLILIDPKILELSVYDGIPHLLTPVVTEPPKAVAALKWVVREMDRRYRAMSQLAVRNIAGYNDRVNESRARGEVVTRRVQTGFDSETGRPVFEEQPLALEPLPFIVVFIDEMADLMLVAGKEIEVCVQRLAQKARAAGIHVIMATQRPSVDVITGTIKANFPTRISFQVISKFDSRTILGEQGAEQLLGQGDLLYMQGGGRITRVHGPFVSDQEVEAVVEYLREQGEPAYLDEVTEHVEDEDGSAMPAGAVGGNTTSENALYDQAVAIVARDRKASTSYLQRCLTIGYNRAAKLIEQMEKDGVVSPANHVGKREVLVRAERGDD